MTSDETNELLREAVRLLHVIARPQLNELRDRFEASMLTSAKRQRMWEAMNGTRTLADIAEEAGTSGEAVRQFVREIEDSDSFADLLESGSGGGPQRPRRRLI